MLFNTITVVRSFFIFFHALLQTSYSLFRFCLSDFPTAYAQNLTTRQRQAEEYGAGIFLATTGVKYIWWRWPSLPQKINCQSCSLAPWRSTTRGGTWCRYGCYEGCRWRSTQDVNLKEPFIEWQTLPFLNYWSSQTNQKHIRTNPKYATASQTSSLSQLLHRKDCSYPRQLANLSETSK